MDNPENPILLVHEWLAVIVIASLLLVFSITAWSAATPKTIETGCPHFVQDPCIEVQVEGAVKVPGKHKIKRGSTVGDLLAIAEVLPEGDPSRLRMGSKVRRNQTIRVPFHKPKKQKNKVPKLPPA